MGVSFSKPSDQQGGGRRLLVHVLGWGSKMEINQEDWRLAGLESRDRAPARIVDNGEGEGGQGGTAHPCVCFQQGDG